MVLNHNSADHLGGAERSLFAILDLWSAEEPSLRPVIASPGPAPAVAAEAAARGWRHLALDVEGWAVFTADGGRGEAKLRERAAATATRALLALIGETHARLVVTNTLVHPWAALAAARAGVPHVWFVREFGMPEQGFIWPGGRETALRELGQLSRTVVANSLAVRDELTPFIPTDRLAVSYPSVDTADVRAKAAVPLPEGAAPFPDPEALRVVVLGRVTTSKGQWRVVEALGLLAAEGVRAQACFVGGVLDRGAEATLSARAAALGASVSFAGERENPFPWVAAAEVAVVPSQREAFGRSTVECLAVGRPVVATREGAGAELITTEVGALFPADDVAGLAAALGIYAADRSLAPAQAEAARSRADALMSGEYSIDAAVRVLRAAVGAPPAEAPAGWTAWLDRLDAVASGGQPGLWRLNARVAGTVRLGEKALRDPRKALRRLTGG